MTVVFDPRFPSIGFRSLTMASGGVVAHFVSPFPSNLNLFVKKGEWKYKTGCNAYLGPQTERQDQHLEYFFSGFS
jgi:hypothetical protein